MKEEYKRILENLDSFDLFSEFVTLWSRFVQDLSIQKHQSKKTKSENNENNEETNEEDEEDEFVEQDGCPEETDFNR